MVLYRSLINNMVKGVSKGFKIKQELVGVGYSAEAKRTNPGVIFGYSHDIILQFPEEIKVETKTEKRANPIITFNRY